MNSRLVITGISVLSPIGENKDEFWTNLTNGVSGIKDITLFDVDKYKSKKAGEITDFNAKEYLGQKRYSPHRQNIVIGVLCGKACHGRC